MSSSDVASDVRRPYSYRRPRGVGIKGLGGLLLLEFGLLRAGYLGAVAGRQLGFGLYCVVAALLLGRRRQRRPKLHAEVQDRLRVAQVYGPGRKRSTHQAGGSAFNSRNEGGQTCSTTF